MARGLESLFNSNYTDPDISTMAMYENTTDMGNFSSPVQPLNESVGSNESRDMAEEVVDFTPVLQPTTPSTSATNTEDQTRMYYNNQPAVLDIIPAAKTGLHPIQPRPDVASGWFSHFPYIILPIRLRAQPVENFWHNHYLPRYLGWSCPNCLLCLQM